MEYKSTFDDKKVITNSILIALSFWALMLIIMVNSCGIEVQTSSIETKNQNLDLVEYANEKKNAFEKIRFSKVAIHTQSGTIRNTSPESESNFQSTQKIQSKRKKAVFSKSHTEPIVLKPNSLWCVVPRDRKQRISPTVQIVGLFCDVKNSQKGFAPLDLYRVTDRS